MVKHIDEILTEKNLFLFKENSYSLALQYNNVEQVQCVVPISVKQIKSPRKARIEIFGEEYSMALDKDKCNFSLSQGYREFGSFGYLKAENIIAAASYDEALSILRSRGYKRVAK